MKRLFRNDSEVMREFGLNRLNLRAKFILGFAAGIIALSVVIVAVRVYMKRTYEESVLEKTKIIATNVGQNVFDLLILFQRLENVEGLNDDLERLVKFGISGVPSNLEYCYITDKDGKILYHSNKNEIGKITTSILKSKVLNERGQTIFTENVRGDIDIGMALYHPELDEILGGVFMRVPKEAIERKVKVIDRIFIFLILASTVIFAIILILTQKSLIEPLRYMADFARSVAKGDFSKQIEIKTPRDETGLLKDALNQMVSDLRDKAELQTSYDKLKELDRAKTNFFSMVSHELKTPLSLIISNVRAVLSRKVKNPEESLSTALNNASRLLQLVLEILDFSKIESGRMNLKKEVLDIVRLTKEVTSHFISSPNPSILRPYPELEVLHNKPEIYAEVDQEKIRKILYNLISNAFKFTEPDTRRVRVIIFDSDSKVEIQVEDNGIGIPQSELSKIFDRFYQVDTSMKRVYGGTGLGLALVKEFIDVHGGVIDVKSQVGKGTNFYIALPKGNVTEISKEKVKKVIARAETEDEEEKYYWTKFKDRKIEDVEQILVEDETAQKPLIAVIEDNDELRDYLVSFLKHHYRIIPARDGKTGLEKIYKFNPEVVLSDIMIPRVSGYDIVKSLREHPDKDFRSLPVIFITARSDPEFVAEGFSIGANDYISKPFSDEELLARVKNWVDRRRQEKELENIKNNLEDLLKKDVEKSSRLVEITNFVPKLVKGKILSGEIKKYKREKITVFVSDLVRFTPMVERLSPEESAAVLNIFFEKMTKIAIEHKGEVMKYIGDALMVIFEGGKEDAKKCMEMAFCMLKYLPEMNKEVRGMGILTDLKVRIAINTGYCTLGIFGTEDFKEYTVIGEPVNLAFRLCEVAGENEIFTTSYVYSMLEDLLEVEKIPKVLLKGIEREPDIYRVCKLKEKINNSGWLT